MGHSKLHSSLHRVLASKNDSSCTTASGIGTLCQATVVVIEGIVGMTSIVGKIGIVGIKLRSI